MNPFLTCLICGQTFEEPVILPCCHTICKKHEKECLENKLSCPECNTIHEMPENGFLHNLIAKNLIKYKFDRLELKPEHKSAIESNTYLKEVIDEFKRLREHPELEITEKIGKLRNKIDLHREEVKKKIDDDAIELIQELDEYESKCKADLSANKLVVSDEIEELFRSLERDQIKWDEELKVFEHKLKNLRKIHDDSISGYEKLRPECEKIKKSIFTDEFSMLEEKQNLFCGEMTADPLM